MPPKKDSSGGETPEAPLSDKEIKLLMLEAKRSALYERMQQLYDASQTAHQTVIAQEVFLDSTETIEDIRSEFKTILDEHNVALLSSDPKAAPDYKFLSSFEDLFSAVKRVIAKLTKSREPLKEVNSPPHRSRPALPPIELVYFDGDIRNWPLFYASFKSNVHDNPSLTNAEKLYYLVGKLSSKAQSVFSGLTPCGENYSIILQALVNRYQDTRTLASSYLDQIIGLKLTGPASLCNFELFIDKIATAANALKNLKLENLSDYILLHIAIKKLDPETVRAFEMDSRDQKLPTLDSLVDFIRGQCKIYRTTQMLTNNNIKTPLATTSTKTRKNNAPNPQAYVTLADNRKCLCDNIVHEHLFKCPGFSTLSPNERFKIIKEKAACVNCLSNKHKSMNCKSTGKCHTCNGRHHSLLHFEKAISHNNAGNTAESGNVRPLAITPAPLLTQLVTATTSTCGPTHSSQQTGSGNNVSLCSTSIAAPHTLVSRDAHTSSRQCISSTTVLLATAEVLVNDVHGNRILVRCLIDMGSQSHFITYELYKRLGLKGHSTQLKVKGIGGTEKPLKGSVQLRFYSRFNSDISYDVTSLIVDRITDDIPTAAVDTTALSHLQSLPLADSHYATPGPIQMLIGASLFPHILTTGMVSCNNIDTSSPPAVETTLGYIIMGSVPVLNNRADRYTTSCCAVVNDMEISSLVKRFWELEEVSSSRVLSSDDVECEEHFRSTTVRDETGRYTVALPFCGDPYTLGDSYTAAHRRFLCLERKLQVSQTLRTAYDDVIREYVDKAYLSRVPRTDSYDRPAYYIPHHGVLREDKASTKLRVVLDASSGSPSLNDLLHAGPNLQGDLFSIIAKFRLFAIALSADCRQMFLQLCMHIDDRRFQRILYRFNPQDPITVFEFNRVCFGLKSSPYHALRVVHQLIEDEGHNYRHVTAACSSLYMDDINFSVMTEAQAIEASAELIAFFKSGQFDLVKWASNSANVLKNIPASHRATPDVEFDKSVPHKILGLRWDKANDYFYFEVAAPDKTCTKRTILSTVARLWDIMGFVAPVVLFAKLLIKELWLMRCDWDDTPPQHIVFAWRQFCLELPRLNEVRIPRHLGIIEGSIVNLVGFADASERAYGGVVYVQVCNGTENLVHTVCAKSKVSPTKPVSIARLELCAAVLLSKLLRVVFDNLDPQYKINKTFAFTDSKVVLCWINSPPHRWQTFVANRVVKLTDNVPAHCFHHVAGIENPADCLSRGVTPDKLIDHPLWFRGPPWISRDTSEWPVSQFNTNAVDAVNAPEQKTLAHPAIVTADSLLYKLAQRVSSYSKLLRIIVYVYRFFKILPRNATVSRRDLEFAEIKLLRVLQYAHFSSDIIQIQTSKPCSSTLMKLKPFLDENGLIRVGGRLTNSAEKFGYKHPVVLPRHDHIVDLLVDYHHKKHLHAGPEQLMSLLRQSVWILAARRIIRHRIHKCNTCFRAKPRPNYPLMADLPHQRTNQAEKAFTHSGVDYAGPLQCTPFRGRGVKSHKTWLCIFTCLTTRATHIEIATDLSTASFLNALKRFLSRRGPVQCLYSDHGTNFVGARSYLRDLYKFLDEFRPHLEHHLAESRIDWKNVPPASPHFAGCMESMVKIAKTHLFKVIGQQILSYEELATLLAQIEAQMNSRPLTVLSSDPSEPTALTPAHFLHTAPLASIPAAPVDSVNLNQRHLLLDQLVQTFWQRWRVEYLHRLQSRAKWNTPAVPIQVGTVVVVITDNIPPFSWPLGVVDKIHPSKDGTTRVVTVKTSKGSYVRPTVRLCPLPNQ